MTVVQRTEPYQLCSYQDTKLYDKSSLTQRVSYACNITFEALRYYICNGAITCANALKLYKFRKAEQQHSSFGFRPMLSQTLSLLQYGFFYQVGKQQNDPYERLKVNLLSNFLHTLSVLDSYSMFKTSSSWKVRSLIKNLANNLVTSTAAFFINFARNERRLLPIAVLTTTAETYFIARRTMQGLKECLRLAKNKPLRSLGFAIVHIATLTVALHKLHETVFNPFTQDADEEIADEKTEEQYRKEKENWKKFWEENWKKWREKHSNNTYSSYKFSDRVEKSKFTKLSDEDRIMSNLLDPKHEYQAAQILNPFFNLANLDLKKVKKACNNLQIKYHPDKGGSIDLFTRVRSACETLYKHYNYGHFKRS